MARDGPHKWGIAGSQILDLRMVQNGTGKGNGKTGKWKNNDFGKIEDLIFGTGVYL